MAALSGGEIVTFAGKKWLVARVWDTNTEGWRANLIGIDSRQDHDRCIAPVSECEIVGEPDDPHELEQERREKHKMDDD